MNNPAEHGIHRVIDRRRFIASAARIVAAGAGGLYLGSRFPDVAYAQQTGSVVGQEDAIANIPPQRNRIITEANPVSIGSRGDGLGNYLSLPGERPNQHRTVVVPENRSFRAYIEIDVVDRDSTQAGRLFGGIGFGYQADGVFRRFTIKRDNTITHIRPDAFYGFYSRGAGGDEGQLVGVLAELDSTTQRFVFEANPNADTAIMRSENGRPYAVPMNGESYYQAIQRRAFNPVVFAGGKAVTTLKSLEIEFF